MALKKSGVQLVAEGDAAFFAVMMQAGRAVVEFGQTSGKAAAGVAAMQQRVTRLTDTIGLQNRQLAIAEQQLKETVAAHGADSIAAQKQQLSIDRLSASIRNNQATVDRLNGELKQLENAQDQAAKGASRLGEVMTGALRRAGEMAINLFVDIGRAALAGIGQAVSMAGDYEQAMNVLQAQSGATDDQMRQMDATAKALGADLTLPATSAVDAGKAMLELSKGGLEVDDAMAAAKGTLQLAAAAETDVATAAQISTAALSAFGLEGGKAGYVADVLTNAANKSRASITDLAGGLQQAGFRFNSAGQGVDDLAASLVILTNNGLSGSDAGTALSNMIARLQAPTDKAAKLMAELGINVYDASGNMLPMQDIIGVVNKGLAGMTQQQRNAALQTIFLTDGMKAMIPLLGAGADGFEDIKGQMNQQGAAAQLAAAQMKGLKGAAAGLQSQVETLMLEALQPLLPILAGVLSAGAEWAGSLVGTVGPAVQSIISFITTVAEVVQTGLVPALGVATVATIAFGVANAQQAGLALALIIGRLAAATTAFLAHAGAVALAAAPYVAMAAAVGAMAYAWTKFQKANADATAQLLAGKQFWIDSTKALDDYGAASAETQAKLKPLADSIKMQRDMLEENIKSLAMRKEAGLITEQQFAAEMDRLNGLATAITFASNELATQTKAELQAAAASMTATNAAGEMQGAQADLAGQVELTADEIEEQGKIIKKAYQEGAKAVDDYVSAAISFEQELTKAIKDGNAEQAQAVADNYAQQAAAAKASMGEQLVEYTKAQVRLGNITHDQAGVILDAIGREFGTTQSIAAKAFLDMEQSIDQFAQNGGSDADALGGHLGDLANDAITTKEKMDALATKYEAELVQNFKEGIIDADELRDKLEDIPAKVYSEVHVHTEYTSSGEKPQSGGSTATHMATGGTAKKGQPYMVGEHGPELFMPGQSGTIIPNHRLPPATPSQIFMPQPQVIVMQPANTTNTVNNNTVNNSMGGGLGSDHLFALLGSRG